MYRLLFFVSLVYLLFPPTLIANKQNEEIVLTVGSEPDYPPFCIVNSSGEADGFSVELLKAVADEMGLKLKFRIGLWKDIKEELRRGDIDILPLVGKSTSREEYFDFSYPYHSLRGTVFLREGVEDIKRTQDLKGLKIAVMDSDSAHEFLVEVGITENLILTDTFGEAFRLLADGKCDAVVVQEVLGHKIIKDMALEKLRTTELELNRFKYYFCFAVSKGNILLLKKLNEGLAIVIEKGIYNTLQTKWWAPHVIEKISFKDRLLIALPYVIIFTFFSGLILIFILRIRLKKRTEDLQRKIKEHSEAESRYKTIFETSANLITSVNAEGIIVDCSDQITNYLGYTKDEIIGQPMSKIIHKDYMGKANINLREILEKGCAYNHEYKFVRKNGSLIDVSINSSGINRLGDVFERTICIIDDVTSRKKAEEIYQRTTKLESIGVLAGGIAHDFNNLLAAIFGNISIASSISKNREVIQLLNDSIDTMERARALTNQLLTFSKNEQPELKIECLFPYLKEVVKFSLSGSTVKSTFSISSDLWRCKCEKNQIAQVVENIVINSVQAMPKGGEIGFEAGNCCIEDDSHSVLRRGKYILLSIKDSGSGIARENLSRIFDPFFTTKTNGNGLGLATSYSIIAKHNGFIDVKSTEGEGTVFMIYLPATSDKVNGKVVQKEWHKAEGKVLVMDDEPAIRRMLKRMLESFGYTPVCFDRGELILEHIRNSSENYKAMFFDLTITGGMGGEDIIARVREFYPHTPIFVVSGYGDHRIIRKPEDYGFTDSIQKPFRRADLAALLNRINQHGR